MGRPKRLARVRTKRRRSYPGRPSFTTTKISAGNIEQVDEVHRQYLAEVYRLDLDDEEDDESAGVWRAKSATRKAADNWQAEHFEIAKEDVRPDIPDKERKHVYRWRKGPRKGQWVSAANVKRAMGVKAYWNQIELVKKKHGLTTKEARALAKAKPKEFRALLEDRKYKTPPKRKGRA